MHKVFEDARAVTELEDDSRGVKGGIALCIRKLKTLAINDVEWDMIPHCDVLAPGTHRELLEILTACQAILNRHVPPIDYGP